MGKLPEATIGSLRRAALIAITLLLPFNSVPWFGSWLGELSGEGWVAGGVLLLVSAGLEASLRGTSRLPRSLSWYLLIAWLAWATMWSLIHVVLWGDLAFKNRTLAEKVVLQTAVTAFVVAVAAGCYSAFKPGEGPETILAAVRKYVQVSLFVPLLWAGLEALSLVAPYSGARDVLRALSEVIHTKPEYEMRLRSVAGEASWFGLWLAFALPWVLSSALQFGGRAIAVLLVVAISVGITFSRFAWASALLISGGFAVSQLLLLRSRGAWTKIGWIGSAMVALAFAAVVMESQKARAVVGSVTIELSEPHGLSNNTRLGMQAAALGLAVSYPLAGVGLGGFGFFFEPFLPSWTVGNPEVEEYVANLPGTAWPSVHSLWARLAAETGTIGLAMFAGAWVWFLRSAWKQAKRAACLGQQRGCLLWLALFWSAVGCVLVGFAFDSLRFGGYWLVLSAGWAACRGASEPGHEQGAASHV